MNQGIYEANFANFASLAHSAERKSVLHYGKFIDLDLQYLPSLPYIHRGPCKP